jgi:ABC-2 type transport system permease protein
MLQAPADVLTGRVSGAAIPGLLGTQVAWLVGMVTLGQVVQRLGTRRLVVQGG